MRATTIDKEVKAARCKYLYYGERRVVPVLVDEEAAKKSLSWHLRRLLQMNKENPNRPLTVLVKYTNGKSGEYACIVYKTEGEVYKPGSQIFVYAPEKDIQKLIHTFTATGWKLTGYVLRRDSERLWDEVRKYYLSQNITLVNTPAGLSVKATKKKITVSDEDLIEIDEDEMTTEEIEDDIPLIEDEEEEKPKKRKKQKTQQKSGSKKRGNRFLRLLAKSKEDEEEDEDVLLIVDD